MILMQSRNKLHNSINVIDILKVMLFSLFLNSSANCVMGLDGFYELNLAKSLFFFNFFFA